MSKKQSIESSKRHRDLIILGINVYIHSFIHSYSFIIFCQNATKHELGVQLTRDCSMTLQYYDKMIMIKPRPEN